MIDGAVEAGKALVECGQRLHIASQVGGKVGQALRGIEKGAQIIDGVLTPFTGIAPGSTAGKLAAAAKITYDERARIQATGKDVVTDIKDGMERLQNAKEEEIATREKLRRKHGLDIH